MHSSSHWLGVALTAVGCALDAGNDGEEARELAFLGAADEALAEQAESLAAEQLLMELLDVDDTPLD